MNVWRRKPTRPTRRGPLTNAVLAPRIPPTGCLERCPGCRVRCSGACPQGCYGDAHECLFACACS